MLASDGPDLAAASIDAVLDLCEAQAAIAWVPVAGSSPRQIHMFVGGELLAGHAGSTFECEEHGVVNLLQTCGATTVKLTDASRCVRLAAGWRSFSRQTPAVSATLELIAGHASAVIERADGDRRLARAQAAVDSVDAQIARARRVSTIGELASGIVHDFNNSLTTILGWTELALGPLGQSDPFFKDLMMIRTATLDAAALVRRLRALSQPAGSAAEREVIDLLEVVRAMPRMAIPLWSRRAQCQGLPFEIVTELGPVPRVHVAPAEIRELLLNLIFNAVDAMPKGGRIALATREVDGEAEITVADQGVGMSLETLSHLFEPFFTTKGERGTGLGLSVCRTIAESHGGRLTVESTPGVGTTFTLRLPAASAEAVAAAFSAVREISTSGGRRRVLLVDDQEEVRTSVGEMLRALGHDVIVAEDGTMALATALRQRLDIVITDLGMPGINGLEVAKRLQVIAPSVAVVLLTGWGLDTTDARPDNVTSVLNKPVTMTRLAEALNSVDGAALRRA
jgi:signal transduction histidine kinase